jgi:hypothetical protein
MLENLLDQVLEKCIVYCSKEENVKMLETRILNPVFQHMSAKFAWLSYSFHTVVLLLVLHTCLLVYILYTLTSLKTTASPHT